MPTPNYLKHIVPLLGSAIRRVRAKPSPLPIGYIGWVGHKNLGDEALYDAIRTLATPLPLVDFSAARESILQRARLSGSQYFRGVLLGGGTIIGPAYVSPVRRTLNLGLPMATFGTGVGSTGFGDSQYPDLSDWQGLL